jgi:hypothetical protein
MNVLTLTKMKNVTIEDLQSFNREQLIEWLCWNDRNGIYRDEDAIGEGFDPLTLEEALEIATEQIKG